MRWVKNMLLIGSHVGFKKDSQLLGSLEEAIRYGENTFMFYTGAPQNTARNRIDEEITNHALEKMKELGMNSSKVIVHAPYIINLCNEKNFDFSVSFLTEEVKRVEQLHLKYLVLHPGSHVGLGVEKGIENIIKGLNIVFQNTKESNVTILLETMAGKGSEIGRNLDELKTIIEGIKNQKRIGVCLDTCHLHDAGYNLSKFDDFLKEFDQKIKISKIGCIHVNDSKNIISSHKDRHENIGFGTIGFDNLINIIYHEKLKEIPKILETPYIEKEYPPYKEEINMIKNKEFDKNMIEKIKR